MVRTLSPERRASFLNAALKLFVSQGVASTSTAEIAKAAGSAAGTLFLYFPTRQALLDELALQIAQDLSAAIQDRLDASQPARDMFFTIWHTSLTWFVDHADAYLFVQQVRDTGMISPEAVEKSGQIFVYYYAAIQKGLQENSIKPLPLDLIGGFLYQDIVAIMNHLRREPDTGKHPALISQGFEIFWDGIKSRDNTGRDQQK